MKIALLTKNFSKEEKDASITTVLALARELIKKGHEAHIITERGRSLYKDKNDEYAGYKINKSFEVIKGVPVHRPYSFPWFRTKRRYLNPTIIFNRVLAAPLGLRYVEKKEKIKFDIIHSFAGAYPFVLMGHLAKKLSKNKKVKLVHTTKSYSLHDKYWFSPGNMFWARLLNLADKITVPSKVMANKLIKNKVKSEKIEVINSFIDLDRFKPQDKDKLKKLYGYERRKILLYYGHWGSQKGVSRLIEISPKLTEEISNLEILFVHPSRPDKTNKKLFEKNKEKGNLKLIQDKVKIEDYINLADLVVLPYTTIKGTETNPLCILESMACKTPIVTTDFDELREILGDAALYAKYDDNNTLAKQIILAMTSPQLRAKISGKANKKVQKYSREISVKKYLSAYEE